jgi:hypothetical protein
MYAAAGLDLAKVLPAAQKGWAISPGATAGGSPRTARRRQTQTASGLGPTRVIDHSNPPVFEPDPTVFGPPRPLKPYALTD